MPSDAFCLSYQANCLNKLLKGGKINKINQPSSCEVIMSVYASGKNYKLVISVNAGLCRVSLTDLTKENPKDAPSFCMLLRKHLGGGTVTSVSQVPNERIIKIEVENNNDFLEKENKILYAEMMGKYSNLILTSNGKILGAIKTAGLSEAGDRPILAGLNYSLPVPQDKIPLTDIGDNCPKDKDLFCDWAFNNIMGFSYQTASELTHRAFNGYYKTNNIKETAKCFSEEKENPCVLFKQGKPNDFFPFPYFTMEGEYKFFDNMAEGVKFYYDFKDSDKIFCDFAHKIDSSLNAAKKKLDKKIKIISDKRNDCGDMELNKIKGELITANFYKLNSGMESCVLENYYDGNKPMKISLDKNLSIQKNAQKYYAKYNKQKRTLEAVSAQYDEAMTERKYLDSVESELSFAKNLSDLKDIADELMTVGIMKKPQGKKAKEVKSSFLKFDIDGFEFIVGKNNIQNDEIVKNAKGGDIWLHAKLYHSAHGLFPYSGKEIPLEVIVKGAKLIAERSGGKNGTKVDIDYTKAKNVKKPKNGKPGFVTYTDFKTVTVNIED